MKRWIKRSLLWGSIFIMVGAGVGYAFRNDLYRAAKRYMRRETARSIIRYGSELPLVDEVVLLRLEEPTGSSAQKTYHVSFTDTPEMAIVAEKTLSGAA